MKIIRASVKHQIPRKEAAAVIKSGRSFASVVAERELQPPQRENIVPVSKPTHQQHRRSQGQNSSDNNSFFGAAQTPQSQSPKTRETNLEEKLNVI